MVKNESSEPEILARSVVAGVAGTVVMTVFQKLAEMPLTEPVRAPQPDVVVGRPSPVAQPEPDLTTRPRALHKRRVARLGGAA